MYFWWSPTHTRLLVGVLSVATADWMWINGPTTGPLVQNEYHWHQPSQGQCSLCSSPAGQPTALAGSMHRQPFLGSSQHRSGTTSASSCRSLYFSWSGCLQHPRGTGTGGPLLPLLEPVPPAWAPAEPLGVAVGLVFSLAGQITALTGNGHLWQWLFWHRSGAANTRATGRSQEPVLFPQAVTPLAPRTLQPSGWVCFPAVARQPLMPCDSQSWSRKCPAEWGMCTRVPVLEKGCSGGFCPFLPAPWNNGVQPLGPTGLPPLRHYQLWSPDTLVPPGYFCMANPSFLPHSQSQLPLWVWYLKAEF